LAFHLHLPRWSSMTTGFLPSIARADRVDSYKELGSLLDGRLAGRLGNGNHVDWHS